MTKAYFACAAAAIAFAFSSVSFSQTTPGTPSKPASPSERTLEQQCSGLTGAALDTCIKQLAEQKRSPAGSGAPVGGTSEPGAAGKAKGGTSY